MDNWIWFNHFLDILAKVILPVVAFFLMSGTHILKDIRKELRMLNGRMIKMEEWREMHDRQDDERFKGLTARLDRHS